MYLLTTIISAYAQQRNFQNIKNFAKKKIIEKKQVIMRINQTDH